MHLPSARLNSHHLRLICKTLLSVRWFKLNIALNMGLGFIHSLDSEKGGGLDLISRILKTFDSWGQLSSTKYAWLACSETPT